MSKTILFQGDSITDCGRSRDGDHYLGSGYANLVKATLGFENPNEYTYINRGISGNRIVDLYARIKCDIINLKPDYMSILIGVNDVWHEIGSQNGVSNEKFEKFYDMLISEIKEALPDTKIIIMGAYVLEGPATCNCEEPPPRWETFSTDVAKNAATAKRIAEKYSLYYIPLQDIFDNACKDVEPTYWAADGVHPTMAGHELIKREWLKAFEAVK